MKNRLELAKYFNELGFKHGAEVGACYGRYSEILCQSIPGLELLAVDNWDNKENDRRLRTRGVGGEETTRKLLEPYNATVVRMTSMEAAAKVPDESLDFVFIDANHSYECVKEDITEWSKKVRSGGIVALHDYYIFPHSGNRGVIDAVDEYIKVNNIQLQIIPWDKENPVKDDRQPCAWFFKK